MSAQAGDDASSDDSMPPLDYVPSPPSVKPATNGDDSDDSMPPLEYVGGASTGNKTATTPQPTEANARQDDASDSDSNDSMPPLEYTGATAPTSVKKFSQIDSSESGKTHARQAELSDESIPPLEYVGRSRTEEEKKSNVVLYAPGDPVILTGLSKEALNGQKGIILPCTTGLSADSERLPVKIAETGQRVSVKRQNLQPCSTGLAPTTTPAAAGSETQKSRTCQNQAMEGATADAAAKALAAIAPGPPDKAYVFEPMVVPPAKGKQRDDEDSDGSMPPLENVKVAAASQAIDQGDAFDDSDDSMPPLEYIGAAPPSPTLPSPSSLAAPPSRGRTAAVPETTRSQDQGSDDSMPPLEYVGTDARLGELAPPRASPALAAKYKVGHIVRLRDLQEKALNGQRAVVVGFSEDANLDIKVYGTSQRIIVHPRHAEKETIVVGQQDADVASVRNESAVAARSVNIATPESIASTSATEASKAAYGASSESMSACATDRHEEAVQDEVVLSGLSDAMHNGKQAPSPKVSDLRCWCKAENLPPTFAEHLIEEDVQSPDDLVCLPEADLLALAVGLKIGTRGRFLGAVRRLTATAATGEENSKV